MCYGCRHLISNLKGNVSLGDACILYPQCLGSPNASCLDGICSCIEGYVPDNSSKCIQSMDLACS